MEAQTREYVAIGMAVVGFLMVFGAIVKFSIIGYYPDEFVPYIILMLAVGGLLFGGKKMFEIARQGR